MGKIRRARKIAGRTAWPSYFAGKNLAPASCVWRLAVMCLSSGLENPAVPCGIEVAI
jgi:hypothetical protein